MVPHLQEACNGWYLNRSKKKASQFDCCFFKLLIYNFSDSFFVKKVVPLWWQYFNLKEIFYI